MFTPSTGDQLRLRVNESALASLAVCDSAAEQVEVLKEYWKESFSTKSKADKKTCVVFTLLVRWIE